MAERKIVTVDLEGKPIPAVLNMATFQIEVVDKGEKVPAQFTACAAANKFKAYVAGLSETGSGDKPSPLEYVYSNLYLYACDLKARSAAREAVAVESTIIKRDGKAIDLMTVPVEKAVAAVNAAYVMISVAGERGMGAFIATRNKLVEQGKATEQNGVLVVKK